MKIDTRNRSHSNDLSITNTMIYLRQNIVFLYNELMFKIYSSVNTN